MTYVLSLTYAPRAQLQDRMVLGQTDVVIGRNIDCHWVIDDPDCIVSGQHCIVSPSGDGYVVTDWSTNGLIVDGAHEPLGEGKSAELRDGTVLQLGDYVISVAVEAEDKVVAVEPVTIEAPRGLTPEALGLTSRSTEPAREAPSASSVPDRPTSAAQTPHEERAQPAMSDTAAQDAPDSSAENVGASVLFPDTGGGADKPRSKTPEPPVATSGAGASQSQQPDDSPAAKDTDEKPPSTASIPDADILPVSDDALHRAFFKGLGLDPDEFSDDPPLEQMEALGERFRRLVDGLVYMLRTRDKQKSNLPVRKTQIGASRNNALKVLPGTERAIRSLVRHEGEGFLEPEEAIEQAFRDLAMHNISTWNGLEAAVRKLVADMNPERFEKEAEQRGWLQRMAAGGNSATHWQLYKEKYKDMSESAEQKFLGTVGTEFARVYDKDRR